MPETAFFETGKTYIRDEPFKAPEDLPVFRCVHIAEHPRDGEPRAFGFAGTALFRNRDWFSTALTPESWADGWVEYAKCGPCPVCGDTFSVTRDGALVPHLTIEADARCKGTGQMPGPTGGAS